VRTLDPCWRRPFRLIQPNLRLIDARELDAGALAAQIGDYGGTVALVNAGGIVAWYPTRLAWQRPNPYLTFDYLGAITRECHRRGIKVLARLDITKAHLEDRPTHADWFRVTANGGPAVTGTLAETCFCGDYWQRFNFQILDEILAAYPVDGIFYNHYRYLTCYCSRCQAAFLEATGHKEIPRVEDWEDPAWLALVPYRHRLLAEYTARVKAHVAARRPDALVTWDYELMTDSTAYSRDSGWGPLLSQQLDVIIAISFDRLTRPQPKWIYQTGEVARVGTVSYRRPTCVVTTYSAIFGNRRVAQPPAQLARDLIQIAAHGGMPGTSLSGSFVQDDRAALPAIKEVLSFVAAHADVYAGLISAAEIAVLYGQRTADNYGRDDSKGRYLAHYRGVYEALTHGRIAFDVLADPAWTAERFSAYRALVLPNAACLSAEEAAALDEFVESGGALIASHETALYDPDGHHRGDFVLRCLGRRFVKRRVMQSAYLRIRDKALFGPDLAETDLFGLGLEQPYGGFGPLAPELVDVDVPGAEAEFIFTERAAENARAPSGGIEGEQTEDLFLTAPVTNNVPEFAYWEGETNTPGLTVNRYGRGRAYYLPWQVARQYHLYGLPTCGLLLARLAEAALGRRTLWTDAPRAVEIVQGRRPDGSLVLHLINSAGLESKPLLDAAPLGPLHIQVDRPIRRATALVSGIDLSVQQDGARACVTLPRLGLFEVVHLE
jgi:hypothetical protein